MKRFTTLLLVAATPFLLFAQKGTITGKVIDKKLAEPLIGCAIRLDDGAGGAVTDYEGQYMIQNVPVGSHKITISYPGYQTKEINEIIVKNGEATSVDVSMEDNSAVISEVVIVATARKESMGALTILQKNSPMIADGISAESIKRTPDRTTGDVIRRVSGASIQDNKFAVIRGLSDRYNIAMLNGALLSSSEPDRKAFSFDIFPSSMLDNLIVVKTATPDLPGEFAGGAILLNTKDIPEENYIRANVSGTYNSITTFKPYTVSNSGATDWLGTDDGSRALPSDFPDSQTFIGLSKDEKIKLSQEFPNDWGLQDKKSALPNIGVQLSGGLVSAADKAVQTGAIFALSYNNGNKLQDALRADYDNSGKLFEFNDRQFKNTVLLSGLANFGMKVNNRHKFNFQTTYSSNTSNAVVLRTGDDLEQQRFISSNTVEYTENHLLTTRLTGEHNLNANGMKLTWGGGFNRSTRDVPSLRRMFYLKNYEAEEGEPFRAFVPYGSADPFRSGRFYSNLGENIYNANIDYALPFQLFGQKQTFKTGALHQRKDRVFDARVMGFIRSTVAGFNSSLLFLPQDSIFQPSSIYNKGFVLDEITNASDAYNGQSALNAAYAMFDNKFGERWRITWGVRMENFRQKLQSVDYSGGDVDIDRSTTNLLPSANITYILNEKNQLRASASKTVTRPEFREIAPFSFYDFYLNAGISGNPSLTPGEILNFDLRYEIYPGQNQMLSVSTFYKMFNNPIEFTFSSLGAGTRNFFYQNIPSAENFGVELEIRQQLDFVGAGWENVMVFGNAALIKSKLDLSNVSAFDEKRALQGQSPYIVNVGVSYNHPVTGLSATLVYNSIGDRISQVGTDGYADIYERHRNLLDFSVSKRIGQRGEVKLTYGDILRPDFIYYQDNNANHKYDEDVDNLMQSIKFGSNISLGFGYRF
ncbi:MAG: TonB-dependent receptor [Lewinellaceae bacterium]|nr:TonB-dependent receptor [Lewinellaceae bacterium]